MPHFRAVLRRQPDHSQARELLAACLIQTGAGAEALRLLADAPSDPGILYLRGLALSRLGREAEARAAFAALFETAPPAQARFLAGRAKLESGQYEEAAADLEAAARLDPTLDGIDRETAKALIHLRRFEEAETRLRGALRTTPSDVESSYLLGAVLVQLGQPAAALAELDRVIALRPGSWAAHYYRGRALLAAQDGAAAIVALEQARALAPNQAPVYFQLARACQAAGRTADAAAARAKLAALRGAEAARDETVLPLP